MISSNRVNGKGRSAKRAALGNRKMRSHRRLLSLNLFFYFLGLLLRAALRPGNRPCTGEVPVPDTGRTAGGPCAPPPSAKDPPHPSKTFFRGWSRTAARSWGQGRAVNRPDQPPCQVDTGRGVLSRDLCTFAPLFAVRPLTNTCRLLNGRGQGRGLFVDSGASCGPLFPGLNRG